MRKPVDARVTLDPNLAFDPRDLVRLDFSSSSVRTQLAEIETRILNYEGG